MTMYAALGRVWHAYRHVEVEEAAPAVDVVKGRHGRDPIVNVHRVRAEPLARRKHPGGRCQWR
jgi:hypothetical protein